MRPAESGSLRKYWPFGEHIRGPAVNPEAEEYERPGGADAGGDRPAREVVHCAISNTTEYPLSFGRLLSRWREPTALHTRLASCPLGNPSTLYPQISSVRRWLSRLIAGSTSLNRSVTYYSPVVPARLLARCGLLHTDLHILRRRVCPNGGVHINGLCSCRP
jgi:hypothetical protein